MQKLIKYKLQSNEKIFCDVSEEDARNWKESMLKDTGPFQVNLRKYCVLGGVIFLDLLEQPPQPQEICGKYTITICKVLNETLSNKHSPVALAARLVPLF